MRDFLVQLSKLLCSKCSEDNYEKCRNCQAYKLVNALLEKAS